MIPSQEKLHFLDSKFCKTGRVHFEEYSSGMLVAKLEYEGSSACVSLFGATLISYIPSGHGETFFLSRVNDFQSGIF